jgi:amidase
LDRIAKHNSKLNAVVTLNSHALHRAEELDRQLDSGNPAGRLHGLPITVKDAFATAGLKTTSGMKNRAHHVPEQNAVAVQRLLDQGCVLLGKTNVPPMITGQETSNAIFGRSHNPFDLARMTGGSSGGAAAAIAAGLSALEIGSDSGGLIRRQPASYCGVFGHYPTHGLVPIRGHLPSISMEAYGKDVDFLGVGPIARSAEDLLECALDILACPDPVDSPHVKFTLQDGLGEKKVSNYKIAAWFDDEACGADPQVSSVLKKLISSLRAAGAKADLKARPHFDLADARNLAFSLWVSASSTPHLTPDALKKYEHISRTDSNGPALSRLRARSELLRHAEWLQLDTRRHSYSEAWSEFFSRYDVLTPGAVPRSRFGRGRPRYRSEPRSPPRANTPIHR